jgi:hypothetical protein
MILMINQEKDMLITGGLIMRKKKITGMSGKRDSGAHLVLEEARREGYNT